MAECMRDSLTKDFISPTLSDRDSEEVIENKMTQLLENVVSKIDSLGALSGRLETIENILIDLIDTDGQVMSDTSENNEEYSGVKNNSHDKKYEPTKKLSSFLSKISNREPFS